MLTERDHARLTSLQAEYGALKAALTEAEQAATAARERYERSRRGTGLRQRLFWWSDPAARAHAEVRFDRDKARAAVAERQRHLRRFAGRLDGELGPMLARLDRRYPALRKVRDDCEQALREVKAAREAFEALEVTVRRIIRRRNDSDRQPEIVAARERYRRQVRRARQAGHSAGTAADRVKDSLRDAGLRAPRGIPVDTWAPRRMPDSAGDGPSIRALRGRVGALNDAAGRLRRLHRELAAVPPAALAEERRIRERARDRVLGEPGPD